MIKEYCFGENYSSGLYLIDSNILIALGNFYYKGKCTPKELTQEIRKFIMKARLYGIDNEFSIIELCYDYNTNELNNEAMQKLMIAYDNLTEVMQEKEIENHKGVGDIFIHNKKKQVKKYNSIYESKFPSFLLRKETEEIKTLFYVMYLYMLKIYQLKRERSMKPLEKINNLFEFMTNEIDVLLSSEFFMATLLFIGEHNEKKIAEKIFKPKQTPELKYILNGLMDLFQYRMAMLIAQKSEEIEEPIFVKFVTADKALYDFISRSYGYSLIISKNMMTPINTYEFQVEEKYKDEWKKYFEKTLEPIMKKRLVESHERKRKLPSNFKNLLKENIVLLENSILKTT